MTQETQFILADFPAKTVHNPHMPHVGHNLLPDPPNDIGVWIVPIDITIKAFARTSPRYEWLKDFCIGIQDDGAIWAVSRGALISNTPRARKHTFGFEIGDVIRIEGTEYTIRETPNQNIAFDPV